MEHWHRSGTALLDEIAATHLPASQIAVWYIGQCGFLFKCGETTFCIDPVLSDLTGPNGSRRRYPAPFAPGQLRADFVLCTHGHADHMAKDTLRGLAQNDETQFIFPPAAGRWPMSTASRRSASSWCRKVPRWSLAPRTSAPFPPPTRNMSSTLRTPGWRWGISSISAGSRSCISATLT